MAVALRRAGTEVEPLVEGVDPVVEVDGVGPDVFEAAELGVVTVSGAQVATDLVPEQVLDEVVGDLWPRPAGRC